MGWLPTVASLFVSAVAILYGRPGWMIGGALLMLPMSLYLGLTPRFHLVGFLPPLFQLFAALAIQRQKTWLAWTLLAIPTAWIAWVAVVVFLGDSAGRITVPAG